MRKVLLLCAASLFVARGILACGGDDAANSDATKDATTVEDAPADNSTSDAVSGDTSTNDGADVGTGDSSTDSSDAGVGTDSGDGAASDSSDASSDAVSDAPLSCVDGGVACSIGMPCCMKLSSVEYGKCVILNLCK